MAMSKKGHKLAEKRMLQGRDGTLSPSTRGDRAYHCYYQAEQVAHMLRHMRP